VDVVLLQSSVLDLKRLQSGQPAFNVATNLQFVVSDLQELRLGLVGLSLGNDWLALALDDALNTHRWQALGLLSAAIMLG
jgi:hypothetical protein